MRMFHFLSHGCGLRHCLYAGRDLCTDDLGNQDISGVVCDGAKPGCALKIATAVQSAVRAANMALNGSGADSHDGIVHVNAEKTLENLGILGNSGMKDANRIILDLMLEKQKT